MEADTLRFLGRFLRPSLSSGHEREVLIHSGGQATPATLFLPRVRPSTRAWVVLHGITVPGRHHEAARRIGRALSAAGHAAIAPEVDPWSRLEVDPDSSVPAIEGGIQALRDHGAGADGIGVIGFSVVGTWVLQASSGPLAGQLRTAVAMGAYADVHTMLAAMITGEFRGPRGLTRRSPNPYGRWIMGANLLPLLKSRDFGGDETRQLAAGALHRLATVAGSHGALADEPVYDSLIRDLRRELPPGACEAFDLLALRRVRSRISQRPEPLPAPWPQPRLTGSRISSLPKSGLAQSAQPVLFHGYGDRLIPYTETLALARLLRPSHEPHVTISRLIGHTKSGEATRPRNPVTLAREAAKFIEFASGLLRSVD